MAFWLSWGNLVLGFGAQACLVGGLEHGSGQDTKESIRDCPWLRGVVGSSALRIHRASVVEPAEGQIKTRQTSLVQLKLPNLN